MFSTSTIKRDLPRESFVRPSNASAATESLGVTGSRLWPRHVHSSFGLRVVTNGFQNDIEISFRHDQIPVKEKRFAWRSKHESTLQPENYVTESTSHVYRYVILLGSALPNCRAGPNSRGWSAERSFRFFSQRNVVEGQNLELSLSVCWRTGSSKNIETFCRLCRCFCKDKPVESVILTGRIKSPDLRDPLLFKNLVFPLFLKYSFSHMVSTLWWTLQNQALLCPLGTRKTNYKKY